LKRLEELDKRGKPLEDYWDDIPRVNPMAKERVGYPTQKPLALLERIIKASSNPGDIVLDPFCGGGTTLVAAVKLGRKFIGIDESAAAIRVSEERILDVVDEIKLGNINYPEVLNVPYDYDWLFNNIPDFDDFKFQKEICTRLGGMSNQNRNRDKGIDGWAKGMPVQVKRSESVGPGVVQAFAGAISPAYKKGIIVAFSFTTGAYNTAAKLKNDGLVDIELVSVNSIMLYNKAPKVTLSVNRISGNEIKAQASAIDEDGDNIAGYSWFVDGKPIKYDISNKPISEFEYKTETAIIGVIAYDDKGGKSKKIEQKV